MTTSSIKKEFLSELGEPNVALAALEISSTLEISQVLQKASGRVAHTAKHGYLFDRRPLYVEEVQLSDFIQYPDLRARETVDQRGCWRRDTACRRRR
jgi:hypothetical protein